MKTLTKVLVLLLFLAPSLQGQEIDAEVGLWFSGPIVQERTHRVRLGNMGQEMYGALQVSDHISEHWRIGGDVMVAPAQLYVYPASPDNEGWFARPEGPGHQESILWSCTTLGAWYDRGWASLGAGLGMCHLSNADHSFFGAAPMHSGAGRVDLTFQRSITEGMDFSLRCRAHPNRVGGKDYTVLQIASGELEPGEHDSGETFWHMNGGCGLTLAVGLGG